MKRLLVLATCALLLSSCDKKPDASATVLPAIPPRPAAAQGGLVIVGTLQALPSELPPNDLYKYAYVMKYVVDTVVEGVHEGREILVGHYDPRTPRGEIADDQKPHVGGNVVGFQAGDRHHLVLRPLDSAWTGAVEDEYPQDPGPRFWATWADKI